MKEYIKIDEEGLPVDSQLFSSKNEKPSGYVLSWKYQENRTWWQPIFKRGKWVENLTDEEIEEKRNEIDKNKGKLSIEDQNSIAILELAESLATLGITGLSTQLGGK